MDPQRWRELVKERDTWVAHNFPNQDNRKHDTIFGVIEEWGELIHHYLKMQQGIRGSDEEHLEEMQDAIGDMTVYLFGVMSYTDLVPPRDPGMVLRHLEMYGEETLLFAMSEPIRTMSIYQFQCGLHPIMTLVRLMELFCQKMGWDYDQIVEDTWTGVSQRDWQKFPTNGLTV